MNHKRIEEQLAHAVSDITPDLFNKISKETVTVIEKEDYFMSPKKHFMKTKLTASIATVCAACIMIIAGINIANNKVASTIGIDVNPSIEITTNNSEQVLSVSALNEDAKVILDDMNLKKVDLDVAINAIIGSMVKNGYIDEVKNAILVSVDNKDEQKAKDLQLSITEDITNTLEASHIKAKIFKQLVVKDKTLEELAAKYGISVGKAEFLMKLISKDPTLRMDQLALMNLEQLSELIATNNINLHGIVDYDEDDSISENIKEAIEENDEDENDEDEDDEDENDEDEDNEDAEDKMKTQDKNNLKNKSTVKGKSSVKHNTELKDKVDDKDEDDDDDEEDEDDDEEDEDDDEDEDEDDDDDEDDDEDDEDDEDDDEHDVDEDDDTVKDKEEEVKKVFVKYKNEKYDDTDNEDDEDDEDSSDDSDD